MSLSNDFLKILQHARAELRDEYLDPNPRPWIVGFSGGKDSTLVLQLVFEMLLSLAPSKRTRAVHVLANDTLVESPIVQAFVDRTLERIRKAVEGLNVPVTVVKTTPDIDHTFWVNLIGRGYPAPNRLFRWCTDRMKIRPTTSYIKVKVAESGEVTLLLGVRRSESSARAKVMKRYDNGTRLNPHNDVPGCMVFRPVAEFSTEDVWVLLMQLRPPWGGTHKELVTLYRNAQGGECPLVTDREEAPSCGSSSARFGCWTCTVVEKDKSLRNFIDNGFEHLEGLADFRDWLKDFSRQSENRMSERRNGNEGVGPLTMDARRTVLAKLQELERTLEIPLISEAEVARIEQIWRDDESLGAANQARKLLNILGQE